MYDIITFGSAIKDTFLRLKNTKGIARDDSLCFPLGAKIFVDELKTSSGGGATNSACTFARQGFKVACFSKVGADKSGEMVIEELEKFKVDTRFIKKDKNYSTALSIILSLGQGDRTILMHKGACHFMTKDALPFSKLKKTKWFYLAPLSGESAKLFEPLLSLAKQYQIKVAANPGNSQIALGKKVFWPLLKQIDVLILNKEEASLICPIDKLRRLTKGILVITDGKQGSMVYDGSYVYGAPAPLKSAMDKTGAGDAYSSGFLSGLLEKNDIEYAVQRGSANAANCIQQIGAKNGLLKKGEWGLCPKVKVEKRIL